MRPTVLYGTPHDPGDVSWRNDIPTDNPFKTSLSHDFDFSEAGFDAAGRNCRIDLGLSCRMAMCKNIKSSMPFPRRGLEIVAPPGPLPLHF
jgi:hypothetical protein